MRSRFSMMQRVGLLGLVLITSAFLPIRSTQLVTGPDTPVSYRLPLHRRTADGISHHDARFHASVPGRRRLPSVPGEDALAERIRLFALT